MGEHHRAVRLLVRPLHGPPSDRLGRKPLLLACCVAFVVVPLPVFSYLASGNASYGTLILVQAFFALLISMFSGPGPAAIAEIFPTKSRSTWMTSGYALAVAIFGGFAPLISVWLIKPLLIADGAFLLPDRRRDRVDDRHRDAAGNRA